MKHTMETIHGATLRVLGAMPAFLDRAFIRFSPAELRRRPRSAPNDGFSFVEQIWHLADLEREGYGVRIRRLQDESAPQLADFDGARLAHERDYASRSLPAGLAAFRAARGANVAALRALGSGAWRRGGTQDGVGPIMLCDIPAMMAEHDAAHRDEIRAWQASTDAGRAGRG